MLAARFCKGHFDAWGTKRYGGARAIVAESFLLKQQLPIVTRFRSRAPDLRPLDRVVAGLCAGLTGRARIRRCAIVLKPATILSFQRLLVRRKYRELFSPKRCGRPGPKAPSAELIAAIVEMKRRNPRFGYQRFADQVNLAFDVPVDKHLVRRVLAKHGRPDPGSGGPSWLTFLGNSKDSLWSVDLFRCESLILRAHWVMVVMDQFTRRIVGFAVCCGSPDGPTVCRMLRHVIPGSAPPTYLSSDHDPLFEYHLPSARGPGIATPASLHPSNIAPHLRPLSSTDITRCLQSYGPLRPPAGPACPSRDSG